MFMVFIFKVLVSLRFLLQIILLLNNETELPVDYIFYTECCRILAPDWSEGFGSFWDRSLWWKLNDDISLAFFGRVKNKDIL